MTHKVAILHTTTVTVEPLKTLAVQRIPQCRVLNFVDDSILSQLIENESNMEHVRSRLIQYARFAEQVGAGVILNACSSVGEVVSHMQQKVSVPVVRIDEPMAEEAVSLGRHIGVVATLSSTLHPTVRLLEAKADRIGKPVNIVSRLAEAAYQCLLAGDKEGHDRILSGMLSELAVQTDIVVLAQASMARVVNSLPQEKHGQFLTSPELGMARVKQLLEEPENDEAAGY